MQKYVNIKLTIFTGSGSYCTHIYYKIYCNQLLYYSSWSQNTFTEIKYLFVCLFVCHLN